MGRDNFLIIRSGCKNKIEEYKKAIAINPKFSAPYNSMRYALRSLEKYDEAGDAFKKYIELIPDDPNPYDSYAELLLKTGQYDASIENYRKALSIRSDFVNSIRVAIQKNDLKTTKAKTEEYAKAAKAAAMTFKSWHRIN